MTATILVWFTFWQFAALAGFPLARPLFSRHKDAGYGFGPVLFILVFTFAVFLTSSLGLVQRSRGALIGLAAMLTVLAALVAYRSRTQLLTDIRTHVIDIALSEALFVISFVLFLVPLLYTDSSRFGERAMDLAILTKLSQGGGLPPGNPYMSGVPLNYYYYGHLIYASVTELLGLRSTDTYLLASATVAALTVAASASMLSRLVAWRAGRFAGLLITCFSMNLAYVRDWISGGGDTFMMSNWMVGNAITETPVYTFLIAELHAHAMAMPAYITALGLAIAASDKFVEKSSQASLRWTIVTLACVLGSVAPTNSWSMISLTIACLAVLLASFSPVRRWTLGGAVGAVGLWLLVVGLAVVAYAPYYTHLQPIRLSPRWVGRLSSQPLGFALHWGLFFWIMLGWAIFRRHLRPAEGGPQHMRTGPPFWVLVLAAALLVTVQINFVDHISQALPLGMGFLASVAALAFASEARADRSAVLSWLLAAVGMLVITLCETIYLDDAHTGNLERATTVFKIYLDAWILLGIGMAAPLARLLRAALAPSGIRRAAVAAWAVPLSLAAVVGATYTASGVSNKTARFESGPYLSAMHFMEAKDHGYAEALRWLARSPQQRLHPQVVAEVVDSDRESGWLSVPTPADAYIAWPQQLVQWNYSAHELRARLDILRRLYLSADPTSACALMKAEGIDLIFFGAKERQHFGVEAEHRFRRPPFHQVFSAGGSSLFTCRSSAANALSEPRPTAKPLLAVQEQNAAATNAHRYDRRRLSVLDSVLDSAYPET